MGRYSHKKAAIPKGCASGLNFLCACVSEGAALMTGMALHIGIFRDLSVSASFSGGGAAPEELIFRGENSVAWSVESVL